MRKKQVVENHPNRQPSNYMTKRIFISADHGMAIIYFLQSDVVPTLLNAGVEIVILTDDETKDNIAGRFARPGLTFEGLRLKQTNDYARKVSPRWQWLLGYLRRVGGSRRINTEAMDSHIWEVWAENGWKFRLGIWIPSALAILLLRNFAFARRFLVQMQNRFTPTPGLYADLFDKYQPDMVIASTPGWRMDRYLLRESARRGIPNMTVIVGWDNSSSYTFQARMCSGRHVGPSCKKRNLCSAPIGTPSMCMWAVSHPMTDISASRGSCRATNISNCTNLTLTAS
jgi:hypothetical protein